MIYRIEIIPERRDDFNLDESSITKARQKHKDTMDIPKVLPSGLSEERRLEIIENILKDLSQKNILDEIRRGNAIPFQLPRLENKTKKDSSWFFFRHFFK